MRDDKKIKYLVLSMALLLFWILGMSTLRVLATDTEESVLTAENYTDSDSLLKANGTLSDKKISDFASEVISSLANTPFPEITEVIPIEYLESTQSNATFYHFGKEYGFYMVKEGNYFDVLLIDFVFEMQEKEGQVSDLEHKIGIKPILQQSFYRVQSETGEYSWLKYGGDRYTYYVANPTFLTAVENENELNYGDNGYSKFNDDGVVLLQSRVNYGQIKYKDYYDLPEILLEFAGQKILDALIDVFDKLTKDAAGVIADIVELGIDLYNESKEVTIRTDNEDNIFTRQSKQAQLENNSLATFSRVAGFLPLEDIVLSADINSYAEFITVLGDANSKSRLYERCEFEIYRRIGSYGVMEKVIAPTNEDVFAFTKIETLYNDKSITELEEDSFSQDSLVYLLENGNQNFTYHCLDTTVYQFSSQTDFSNFVIYNNGQVIPVTKINNQLYEVTLEKDKDYEIIFSSEEKKYHNFTFAKKHQMIESMGDYSTSLLKLGESGWFKYTSNLDEYITLEYDESKFILNVFNEQGQVVQTNDIFGEKEFYVENGKTYLIKVYNNDMDDIRCDIGISGIGVLNFNENSNPFSVNGEKQFKFYAPLEGLYTITCNKENISTFINVQIINGCYSLSEGYYYVTVSGHASGVVLTVNFKTQAATVIGYNTVELNGNSVFVKFTAPQSLKYVITLPNTIVLTHIICDNEINNISDVSTMQIDLIQSKEYYFRLESNSSSSPLNILFNIKPKTEALKHVNASGLDIDMEISGSGIKVIEMSVMEPGVYEISGIENFTLYDSALNQYDPDSFLPINVYYIKFDMGENSSCNLKVAQTGLTFAVGDVISISESKIFRYNLIKGEEYEIRIVSSGNNTCTYNVEAFDRYKNACTIVDTDNVYTFTALEDIVFVKVTFEGDSNQAIVFSLLSKNTPAQGVKNVIVDEIVGVNVSDNGFVMIIPSGSYDLRIKKGVTETIKLYQIFTNGTTEITGTTAVGSELVIYSLTLESPTKFIVYTDFDNMKYWLSYNNNEYFVDVVNSNSGDELQLYNQYEFALFRQGDNGRIYINGIEPSAFSVFYDGEQLPVESENNKYIFEKSGTINVSINCWGVQLQAEFTVVEFGVSGQIEVYYNGIYYKLDTDFSSNLYVFQYINYTLYAGDKVIQSTYYEKNINIDITEYVYDSTLSVHSECVFMYNGSSLIFENDEDLYIPVYKINNVLSVGESQVAVFDATHINSSCEVNKTIIIPESMVLVYFRGVSGVTLHNLNVKAEFRSEKLGIYMENFMYTFTTGIGLHVEGDGNLYLNIKGECSICPRTNLTIGEYGLYGYYVDILGNGSLTVKAGTKIYHETYLLRQGLPGIYAYRLNVKVAELYVKGGRGANGNHATENYSDLRGKPGEDGGVGGDAISVATYINVYESCKYIVFESGDGGHGGNGADGLDASTNLTAGGRGGNGGDGGSPGWYYIQNTTSDNISFPSQTHVEFIDGLRGNGGDGGDGGNGGRGGNGGNGGFGGDGNLGGLGGNGGDGGWGVSDSSSTTATKGGNGGHGGHGGYSYANSKYEKPGDGGNGGTGGDPGTIGNGLPGGDGGYGYNGGNGGTGGWVNIVFSKGGDAGDGGDAYGGTPGSAGTPGEGIWASPGATGNAGMSYGDYQNYPWNNN